MVPAPTALYWSCRHTLCPCRHCLYVYFTSPCRRHLLSLACCPADIDRSARRATLAQSCAQRCQEWACAATRPVETTGQSARQQWVQAGLYLSRKVTAERGAAGAGAPAVVLLPTGSPPCLLCSAALLLDAAGSWGIDSTWPGQGCPCRWPMWMVLTAPGTRCWV